jgi:hypothetical protein
MKEAIHLVNEWMRKSGTDDGTCFRIKPHQIFGVPLELGPNGFTMECILIKSVPHIMDLVGGRHEERLSTIIFEILQILFFALTPAIAPDIMILLFCLGKVLSDLKDDSSHPVTKFSPKHLNRVGRNILERVMEEPSDDNILIIDIMGEEKCHRVWVDNVWDATYLATLGLMEDRGSDDRLFDALTQKHKMAKNACQSGQYFVQ